MYKLKYYKEFQRYKKWFLKKAPNTKLVNYAYKAEILNSDIPKKCNGWSWLNFYGKGQIDEDYYEDIISLYGTFAFDEGLKINNARYHRAKRLKTKIDKLLSIGLRAVFLTFTFSDSHINDPDRLLRDRVNRYLRKFCVAYVANADYGEKRGRLHFHAVALINDDIPLSKWRWGNLDCKLIKISSDPAVLGNYINKLYHHAIKETTKRSALMYSRNFHWEV